MIPSPTNQDETVQILQEKVKKSAQVGLELFNRLKATQKDLDDSRQLTWMLESALKSCERRNEELSSETQRLKEENLKLYSISCSEDGKSKSIYSAMKTDKDALIVDLKSQLDHAQVLIKALQEQMYDKQLELEAIERFSKAKINSDENLEKAYKLDESSSRVETKQFEDVVDTHLQTPERKSKQSTQMDKSSNGAVDFLTPIQKYHNLIGRTPHSERRAREEWLVERNLLQAEILSRNIQLTALKEELSNLRSLEPTPYPSTPSLHTPARKFKPNVGPSAPPSSSTMSREQGKTGGDEHPSYIKNPLNLIGGNVTPTVIVATSTLFPPDQLRHNMSTPASAQQLLPRRSLADDLGAANLAKGNCIPSDKRNDPAVSADNKFIKPEDVGLQEEGATLVHGTSNSDISTHSIPKTKPNEEEKDGIRDTNEIVIAFYLLFVMLFFTSIVWLSYLLTRPIALLGWILQSLIVDPLFRIFERIDSTVKPKQ